MEGRACICKCGTMISRVRDRARHEKSQKHLLIMKQTESVEPVLEDPDTCTHHWRIDSSNGPHSNGYCLRCGSERLFANSVETDNSWRQRAEVSYKKK